jgi:endonuclease/exonuclease/phosphatase family metal-dependent hydrolase
MNDRMVVVATYNVHSCIGNDGCLEPRRVAHVIGELDADIIALQEVDAQHRIEGYLDQWKFLAAATDLHCTPGISLRTHRRNFGNALLTRHPVRDVRLHDISFGTREPRGAIDVTIIADGRPLRVVATHLGLRRIERHFQAELLSGILANDPGDVRHEGTLLLGDLNEWRPHSHSLNEVLDHFHPAPAPRSFPALRPFFALDRIVVAGTARLSNVIAHGSKLARLASDHLPVRALLSWN